jgi:hypothetical protein
MNRRSTGEALFAAAAQPASKHMLNVSRSGRYASVGVNNKRTGMHKMIQDHAVVRLQ